MKYSVIIPLYNRENTITTCVKGLLDTSFTDFEVIIVDDGSADSSYDVSRSIEEMYANVHVYRQENKGVSAARNLGIEKAKGEYIMFLDSDDTFVHDALADIDKLVTQDLDLLMFLYASGRLKDKTWERRKTPKSIVDIQIESNGETIDWIFTDLAHVDIPFYTIWAKVFKKSVLDRYNIRFDEIVSLGEDQIFVCEYLKYVEKFRYVNYPYYNLIIWPTELRTNGLGLGMRTPDNFLYNQKANYEALMRLSESTGLESVYKYAVNYILDRPITRILFRNLDLRNKGRIRYSELKETTFSKILPVLKLEEKGLPLMKAKDIAFYAKMILKRRPFWITYGLIFLQQNILRIPIKIYRKTIKALK